MKSVRDFLIGEKNNLQEKIIKLAGFIGTESWLNLDEPERFDMIRQFKIMCEYRTVLNRRLECTRKERVRRGLDD